MSNFEWQKAAWARKYVVLAAALCLAVWLVAPLQAGAATATLSPTDVKPLDLPETVRDEFIRFTVTTDVGTATLQSVSLSKATGSTIADANLQARLIRSTDTTYGNADDVVIAGPTTFTGGALTFSGLSEAIGAGVSYYYFVDLQAALGTAGQTAGVNITGFSISPGTAASTNLPTNYGTVTISAAPRMTVTATDYPAAASATQGQTSVPLLKFQLSTDKNTVTWTAMKLDKIGTNVNLGDVSFKIWKSASNTSTFSAAADAVVGSGVFTAATGQSVTLSQQQAIGTTAQWFFMTYSIHTAAATATSVGAQLANNTYFTMNGGTVNAFTSTASGTPTIGSSGATISILNPRDGGKVGGTFKVQVLVYVPSGLANLTTLQLSNNGGADYTFYTFNLANQPTGDRNTNYSAGTNAAIYEKSFTLTDGSYHFKAQVTVTGAGTAVSRGVRVSYTAALLGDGMLLVRDNSSQLCMDCHALNTHSSQSTSTSYGNWATVCLDCHTPHNTRNVSLIRETVQTPNSGTKTKVDFRNTTGDAPYSYADSTNTTYTYNNVCQVCHTQTKNPSTSTARWQNSGATFDAHYTAGAGTQKCTNCHSHKDGFKGGESGGDVPCGSCHSNIWTPMNTTATTYHHYLQNADVTVLASGSKYPLVASLGATTDANRRCLVCHVDHDIFRPDLNASGGRGKNLRTDANVLPTATTDFTNTDFDATGGGVCLSCHVTAQTKSYTQPDSTTVTPIIPYSDTKANQIAVFNLSKHQFAASSTFSGGGTSTFSANCVKCHNDTLTKDKQTSTNKFGLHDSTLRTMVAPLGATPTDPLEQNFCFRCHSARDAGNNLLTTYWATGNQTTDWYGVATMNTPSVKPMNLYALYNDATLTSKHNVSGYSGLHRPAPGDENRTYLSANKHVECADCHNPHAAKAGTHAKGTSLVSGSGALTGATGVTVSFGATNWSAPSAYPTQPAQATYEYEICFKCHSSYNTSLTTWNATWTDKALEFNPNNLSYHAVAGASKASTTYGAYINGWTATSRMYCSDCHTNSKMTANDPVGPHASANSRILLAPWSPAPGVATPTTALCLQCHDANTYMGTGTGTNTGFSSGTTNLHREHASGQGISNYRCTMCHAARPHGWQRQRLIVYSADPPPYRLAGETDNIGAWTINTGNYVQGNCTGGVGQCTAHP